MEELDARAFRGHRRSLDDGRNPACDERVLSTLSGQSIFSEADVRQCAAASWVVGRVIGE